MRAVILAGGKGKRLAPYTAVLPKPLLPVGDFPILEILLRQLKFHQIQDITLCVRHLGTLLETYFGKGEKWGLKISYSYEQAPMGTAGPIGLVQDLSNGKDPFLVMNGDLLTTLNFSEMLAHHKKYGRIATIGLVKKETKIDLGVVDINEKDLTLSRYTEKPTFSHLISMGIYVFEPRVLEHIVGKGKLDLPDLMIKLYSGGEPVTAYLPQCDWVDIGRPEEFYAASELFEKDPSHFIPLDGA